MLTGVASHVRGGVHVNWCRFPRVGLDQRGKTPAIFATLLHFLTRLNLCAILLFCLQ